MDVDEGVFEWDWKWQTGEETTLGGSRRDVEGRCEGDPGYQFLFNGPGLDFGGDRYFGDME